MNDNHHARPIFVYGTLRPGHGNYTRLLEGNTTDERPGRVKGHALYGTGIPYAVKTRGAGPVIGAVIWIHRGRYADVLRQLDILEGYRESDPDDSLYVRVLRPAVCDTPLVGGGSYETFHQVWMYVAGPQFKQKRAALIESGDWETHIQLRSHR